MPAGSGPTAPRPSLQYALRGALLLVTALAAIGCEKEVVRVKAGANGFLGADAVVAGDASGTGDAATSDATGSDGGPGDGPCTEGALRCKDGTRERCDAAQTWQLDPCPAAAPACVLGACVPCSAGQSRCGALGRETCDDRGRYRATPCPATKPTCVAGGCKVCLAGQRFCVEEGASVAAAICDAKGDEVESLTACAAGVACKAGWCQICTPGALRCDAKGRQRCADHGGAWQGDPCPSEKALCAGEGVCRACEPGTLRCAPDAITHVERCAADGQSWQPEAICGDGGICHDGACKACKPGSTRCLGSRVLVCDGKGEGYGVLADCASQYLGCQGGACSCAIGSTSCAPPMPGLSSGAAVTLCDATGSKAAVAQACQPGQICDAAACKICKPGELRCEGDTVLACKPDASGFAPSQLCADAGQLCAGAACVQACAGTAGVVGCSFALFDPPRPAVSSSDPAPATTAQPLTLHLTPRVATLAVQSVQVGGLGATPPNGTAAVGATLSASLASWNKPASASPTSSGQPPAVALSLDTAAALLASFGSSDQSAAAASVVPAQGQAGTYHVVSWPSEGAGAEAWLAVIDRGGGGTLQLTLRGAVQASPKDAPGLAVPALAKGASWQTTLPAGGVLLLLAEPGEDLTGSVVQAGAAVVVLSGHRSARVPQQGRCLLPTGTGPGTAGACLGDGALCFFDADCGAPCCGDPMFTPLAPVAAWGTVHVVARSAARGDAPDVVRVVAAQSGTLLFAAPDLGKPRILLAGEPVDLLLQGDAVLVADGPVAVVQLLAGGGATGLFAGATGDPAMAALPPVTRWSETHAFPAPSGLGEAHLAVAAPSGTVVTLDDAPLTGEQPITSSGFSAWRSKLAAGTHRLVCSKPCQAVAHGFGKASGWMTSVGTGP